MSNEKDYLSQTFATFQAPRVGCYHCSNRMANQDTTLLPKSTSRDPDHYRRDSRSHSRYYHRLPDLGLQKKNPVLVKVTHSIKAIHKTWQVKKARKNVIRAIRKGGSPCST